MTSKFLCTLILISETPDALANFYGNVLELTLDKRNDGFSCMLGNTHFAIHGLKKNQVPTSGLEIGIYIADVDTFVKKLESKNVEIIDPIREYPWARSAQIRDPQGNAIYLMQLPESSLKEIKRTDKSIALRSGTIQ